MTNSRQTEKTEFDFTDEDGVILYTQTRKGVERTTSEGKTTPSLRGVDRRIPYNLYEAYTNSDATLIVAMSPRQAEEVKNSGDFGKGVVVSWYGSDADATHKDMDWGIVDGRKLLILRDGTARAKRAAAALAPLFAKLGAELVRVGDDCPGKPAEIKKSIQLFEPEAEAAKIPAKHLGLAVERLDAAAPFVVYSDGSGREVYRMVKLGKDWRPYTPVGKAAPGHFVQRSPMNSPLFDLPALAADTDRPVLVVDSDEDTAELAAVLGEAWTVTAYGDDWTTADLSPLKGRRVLLAARTSNKARSNVYKLRDELRVSHGTVAKIAPEEADEGTGLVHRLRRVGVDQLAADLTEALDSELQDDEIPAFIRNLSYEVLGYVEGSNYRQLAIFDNANTTIHDDIAVTGALAEALKIAPVEVIGDLTDSEKADDHCGRLLLGQIRDYCSKREMVFNTQRQVGFGAAIVDDRPVFFTGRHIIADGAEPRRVDATTADRFFSPTVLQPPSKEAADDYDPELFRELCKVMHGNWVFTGAGRYGAEWMLSHAVAQMLLGGMLPMTAAMLLHGLAGHGKSSILKKIVVPLLGRYMLPFGDPSSASFYNLIQSDAVGLYMDEVGGSTGKMNDAEDRLKIAQKFWFQNENDTPRTRAKDGSGRGVRSQTLRANIIGATNAPMDLTTPQERRRGIFIGVGLNSDPRSWAEKKAQLLTLTSSLAAGFQAHPIYRLNDHQRFMDEAADYLAHKHRDIIVDVIAPDAAAYRLMGNHSDAEWKAFADETAEAFSDWVGVDAEGEPDLLIRQLFDLNIDNDRADRPTFRQLVIACRDGKGNKPLHHGIAAKDGNIEPSTETPESLLAKKGWAVRRNPKNKAETQLVIAYGNRQLKDICSDRLKFKAAIETTLSQLKPKGAYRSKHDLVTGHRPHCWILPQALYHELGDLSEGEGKSEGADEPADNTMPNGERFDADDLAAQARRDVDDEYHRQKAKAEARAGGAK